MAQPLKLPDLLFAFVLDRVIIRDRECTNGWLETRDGGVGKESAAWSVQLHPNGDRNPSIVVALYLPLRLRTLLGLEVGFLVSNGTRCSIVIYAMINPSRWRSV